MSKLPDKFTQPYEARNIESKIYDLWLNHNCFSPIENSQKEPFSMVLPPPNVTGNLHLGSSLMVAIQDTVTRFARMQGRPTTWIPGTDHASIATESKVRKQLEKSGVKTRDLPKEELLKHIETFAEESQSTILTQIKALGASLDWDRLAYTLDDERQAAVSTAFIDMYNAGLIYRGHRIINWDPKGQTTISDEEIVYEERDAILYELRYSPDFPITIATTRPETKVGDAAVAVHPDDPRYKSYIGKTFKVDDFCGTPLNIKVIGDKIVDPEFGTGAVGVTPAHSFTDFDMATKHDLPVIPVINEYAKMTVGHISGEKTSVARESIVTWLREHNLLISEQKIKQNLSTAERTGGIIEPLPKEQWFIDVNKPFTMAHSEIAGIESGSETTLKHILQTVVRSKQITILPERFTKQYFNWVDNLRDWCISRQILFGHRIPAWYKDGDIKVQNDSPGTDWQQDPDTLDTWFSSGLWTFSTLGWPKQTADLKHFHPTTLLETGYDILPFWVTRMILMSAFHTGQIPFKTVYLHGLVRDEQGRKLSKSLGNITDPRDMIDTYGADSLRMALLVGVGPGADSNLGENKVRAYRKFSNKIWNITRFILENQPESTTTPATTYAEELKALEITITNYLSEYKLHLAAEDLYHFIWHRLADEILEKVKVQQTPEELVGLYLIWQRLLILLHPFMPFITEEIWQSGMNKPVGNEEKTAILAVTPWPDHSS